MVVDVDKLTDAELRTKLIEFGFPVMPITGTTRKVMAKKLKLLLETKNKVGSSDGRRSLGRYSSEEESDTDVKTTKKDKNRRVTMAAPVSSTSTRSTKKVLVDPEIVSSSPRKQEILSTTTTTTTRSRVVKNAQDDFDTGSDSESDIVASSHKYDTSPKYEDSYNDVEFNKKRSPVLGSLSSSYSRYSPPKSDDVSFNRNLSFGANISPSRHGVGETTGLGGSLASDYAAEKLNQIRSRLSLGSPGYDRSATYTTASAVSNNINLEEKDTPFLSNFTKRLSALNSTKKTDFDSKNDLVKEHDTNGSSTYGRSYLANFRATKGREPTYEYKNRDGSGKNNLVSFAVLAGAALFFIFLAVVYLGMRSDTSMITSGFASPVCILHDSQSKKGVNCIHEDDIQNAVNLLNSIRPELHKRAVAHRCFDPTIKPHMTESEIITFCTSNYGIRDPNMIKHDLRNLEVMIFSNPEWGVSVAQMERSDGAVVEENVAKNMEQVIFNMGKKLTSLVILNPDLPYKCTIYNTLSSALFTIAVIGLIFTALYLVTIAFKLYRGYEMKKKEEVNYMVERIIEILQGAANEESETNYVVINHVRDMILTVKERNAKQKSWEQAVRYINENESRVRTEVQTVQGEPFEVWRWIGSANLSMSMTGDTADHKYRSGRRIVDVQYIINQTLLFPHRPFFFCQSKDVEIKHEVREGFFSVYVLRCKRCLKEHPVCSEEPKNDLLDVNLACVAGIVSLGLDLFQLNELCSSMRIPPISGKNFDRYLNEIHDIYKDSKKESREGSFDASQLISSTPQKPSKRSRKSSSDHSDHSKSNGRLITALEDVDSSLTQLDLEEKRKNFLKELEKDLEKIEKSTLKQRNEELWFNERKKRLTASNFGRIYKLLDKTNRTNIVKDLLYSKFKGNIYTEYGQENEDNAIVAFENKTGKKVEKCGLVIHKDYPFLAASPDGVVVGEDALIEIKCPYKAQNSSVEEAIQKKEIQYATYVDGALTLKREDKYYYQVQGQLHVTGKKFCYFVVWTPKGMAIELIRKDDQCWEKMFPKLQGFYFDHLLPEILQNTSSPRKSIWQGQAFDTHPGSANSPAYSPTPCLKVRGMVDESAGLSAAAAREAVLSKVAHRCRILHCHAEVTSGCVYLRCGDAQDAAIAFKNLHGWWYSGQLVTVKYLRLERYQQRFPDAPSGPPYLKSLNPSD